MKTELFETIFKPEELENARHFLIGKLKSSCISSLYSSCLSQSTAPKVQSQTPSNVPVVVLTHNTVPDLYR